ncbi:hypothetical protein [Dactylosporangium sp. NPDC050588]|uniref:hypothetical protein n=1 Tax=Dactylosporangium sp. NPDC050588 TaxID=3157211 RepID=UPI0034113E6D
MPVAENAAEVKVWAASEARTAARRALAEGVVSACQEGASQAEIARQNGYFRKQARRILHTAGVELEKRTLTFSARLTNRSMPV